MNAVTLSELNQAGIVATVGDGKLRLFAPAGRLTPSLRERIAGNRDALLLALQMHAHLLELSAGEGVDAAHVHRLHDEDVVACAGLSDDTLRAYLHALERGRVIDAGKVPDGYTKACHCAGCGPVLLWPECPEQLSACPWCFRRKAGKTIPRPTERSQP